MGVIFVRKSILARLSRKVRHVQARSLCSNNKPPTNNSNINKEVVESSSSSSSLTRYDAYKELDNLNFTTAAKILFSDPPKKKKFGYSFRNSLSGSISIWYNFSLPACLHLLCIW
ncbi:unnamed protein product [Cuscuta europaea]|uniref:Uncharacterized protein n=1 Tax=Cuscuta europaea TaxID=41803 RepID=A0A9P0ZLT5_CUSEU|nr:unnamed protein product [Cuscuta europaea]